MSPNLIAGGKILVLAETAAVRLNLEMVSKEQRIGSSTNSSEQAKRLA